MAKKLLCILITFVLLCFNSCTKKEVNIDYTKACIKLVIEERIFATGFIINDECNIITAAHSFKACYDKKDISILAQIDGYTYALKMVALDFEKDVALIKGDFSVSNFIDLDNQSNDKGKYAYVVGNTYGKEIISTKVQILNEKINICTDTKSFIGAIFSGDIKLGYSGAPVMGTDGHIMGMVIGKSSKDNTIYALSPIEINTFTEEYI